MLLHQLQNVIDGVLPPATALSGDAIGLQVASVRQTAHHVLIAYELTDEVLDEAVRTDADVVLAFHPLIYRPLSSISDADRVGRLVRGLVLHDVSVIVVHTTLDVHPRGTSWALAERWGFAPLCPIEAASNAPGGMGVLATIPGGAVTFEALLEMMFSSTHSMMRYCTPPKHEVSTIGIVAGSGMPWCDAAYRLGADVYITADTKYHDYHAARGRIGLIDPGHHEMERHVPHLLHSLLREHLPTTALTVSSVNTNPVRYLSPLSTEH